MRRTPFAFKKMTVRLTSCKFHRRFAISTLSNRSRRLIRNCLIDSIRHLVTVGTKTERGFGRANSLPFYTAQFDPPIFYRLPAPSPAILLPLFCFASVDQYDFISRVRAIGTCFRWAIAVAFTTICQLSRRIFYPRSEWKFNTRLCYTDISCQESFVSPVTYDPKTGLYIQTFPEEHTEFLRTYGQRIEIPESNDSRWSYSDVQFATGHSEQKNSFYYNPGSYQVPSEPLDNSMTSPIDDDHDLSMMQYTRSPTPAPAQIHRPYASNTIAPTDLYGAMVVPNVTTISTFTVRWYWPAYAYRYHFFVNRKWRGSRPLTMLLRSSYSHIWSFRPNRRCAATWKRCAVVHYPSSF
jgi:hypothetical protein